MATHKRIVITVGWPSSVDTRRRYWQWIILIATSIGSGLLATTMIGLASTWKVQLAWQNDPFNRMCLWLLVGMLVVGLVSFNVARSRKH